MPERVPLEPSRIWITAVQFVGTNVEMTYLVDAPAGEAEPRLDALLETKLGLYAITATGEARLESHESVDLGSERPLERFSVIASPLDRLFHKIGPSDPLTLIKHASLTLDLSEVLLARQAQGLLRTHAESAVWPTWDVGKLVGTLMRRSKPDADRTVRIANGAMEGSAFPNGILPTLPAHVRKHGGVRVDIERPLLEALAGDAAA